MKRFLIVGAGASGLISAILIKKNHQDDQVFLMEQNDIYGKKLKTTGNGRCNIAPIRDNINAYNDKEFVKQLFEEVSFDEYLKTLEELGIAVMNLKDQGYYPISLSASNVVEILVNHALSLGVEFLKDTFVDFENKSDVIVVKGEIATYECERLILALGSNSGVSNKPVRLPQHGYQYTKLRPGLTAVKVFENTHLIKDVRVQACLSLVKGKKSLYQETGEIIFKEDGLSGICVMNATNYIEEPFNEYSLVLNMWERPNVNISKEMFISQKDNLETLLLSYFNKQFVKWYMKRSPVSLEEVYEDLSHVSFKVKTIEDFVRSQITKGGLKLSEINPKTFESNREKNVYFIGEMLDVNGLCGGYNLRFAITSAIALAKHIK